MDTEIRVATIGLELFLTGKICGLNIAHACILAKFYTGINEYHIMNAHIKGFLLANS